MLLHGLLLIDPRHPPEEGWVRVEGERIAEVGHGPPPGVTAAPPPGRIVCPSFTDAHIHLPQIDSVGCAGMPLLEWLDRVVFPAEAWWGRSGGLSQLRTAVRRMLRHGTTGFAGYLTSHGDVNARVARELASPTALPARMRCVVGRVAMDRDAPEELTREDRWRAGQSPQPSVALAHPEGADEARVSVSVNPRFALSCSDELHAECGWLVAQRARDGRPIFVQTHLSESREECALVAGRFAGDPHYAGVYHRSGLLGERTLVAHCLHLARDEWALLASTRAVAVHCPTANTFLGAGLFNLDAAEGHGVRVALGSDVAAGPDVAMPRVARAMIETAQIRRMTAPPGAAAVRVPSPAEAWDLITRGNADALGWSDGGRIQPRAWADLLTLRVPETWLDEWLVGRLLYNWSDGLIESRVVAGRVVEPGTI